MMDLRGLARLGCGFDEDDVNDDEQFDDSVAAMAAEC